MAHVIVQAVASLDGFIARPDDVPGPIFDWYDAGEVEIAPGDPERAFHVSRASADYMSRTWQPTSVMVIGRTLFDIVNGWEGRPASGEHVFVVTHREAAQWQRERGQWTWNLELAPGLQRIGEGGDITATARAAGGFTWSVQPGTSIGVMLTLANAGLVAISPDTRHMILASQIDYQYMRPVWELAVADFSGTRSAAELS